MQIAKRFITALFAAQLFITAALCAVACCVSEPVSQKTGEESAKPAGHCHARQSARSPTPVARISTSHHACHKAKSSQTIGHRLCACRVEREEPGSGIAISALSAAGRDDQKMVIALVRMPQWLADASPPDENSPPHLRAHSPPHPGVQLCLRI